MRGKTLDDARAAKAQPTGIILTREAWVSPSQAGSWPNRSSSGDLPRTQVWCQMLVTTARLFLKLRLSSRV
jgi:hypothetical protein